MDGASKFVRGDAIAGLLITSSTSLAASSSALRRWTCRVADAGHAYTLLTVGDGLVSQSPALIVSTAAGLLVSKAGVTGAADKALVNSFRAIRKRFGVSSFVMSSCRCCRACRCCRSWHWPGRGSRRGQEEGRGRGQEGQSQPPQDAAGDEARHASGDEAGFAPGQAAFQDAEQGLIRP